VGGNERTGAQSVACSCVADKSTAFAPIMFHFGTKMMRKKTRSYFPNPNTVKTRQHCPVPLCFSSFSLLSPTIRKQRSSIFFTQHVYRYPVCPRSCRVNLRIPPYSQNTCSQKRKWTHFVNMVVWGQMHQFPPLDPPSLTIVM